MRMTNRWNQIVYRLWAPCYDAALEHFFHRGRARAIELLNLQPGERVLLVGVGTGADLPLLAGGVRAVGVDISPEMLDRAHLKLPLSERAVLLVRGDAQLLSTAENSFDAVVFNLILSVIPDAAACLRENLRALKPGGRAVVFDKFLPDNFSLRIGRRLLNLVTSFFGTDITRRFGDLSRGAEVEVVSDEPSLMNGTYRVKLLKRVDRSAREEN